MRTRVTRSFSFEAAHHLPFHPGKCHRYRLDVTVEGPVGDDGMVIDFDALEAAVGAELESASLNLVGLRLWETPDSSVELGSE